MESNADQVLLAAPKRTARRRVQELTGRLSLENMRVSQKLALIAATFAIPVAVQFALIAGDQQQTINAARLEATGSQFLVPLSTLLSEVEENATAQVQARTGKFEAYDQIDATAAKIDAGIKELHALASANPRLGLTENVKQLEALWTVAQDGATGQITDTVKMYGDTMPAQIASVMQAAAINSRLTVDPELESYFTQDLLVNKLPDLHRLLSQMSMLIEAAERPDFWTSTTREQLRALATQAANASAGVLKSVEHATAARPSLEGTLGAAASEFDVSVQDFLQQVGSLVGLPALSREQVAQTAEIHGRIHETSTAFTAAAQSSLDRMLEQRIARNQRNRAVTLLAIAAIVAAAVFLLLAIARSITRPLRELAVAARGLAGGNLAVAIQARGNDELAEVSRTFNGAVTQLREVAERNELERLAAQRLQTHINEFLDVTMDIADGDLTRRGRVSEDILGSVVDATNLAVDQIAALLREVQQVAQQVQGNATEMAGSSSQLSRAARQQAEQAEQMQTQAARFTEVFRESAARVSETARAAELTLSASQSGQAVVQETREGLETLRREMSDISGSMSSLVERSNEISEIAEAITSFASQTTLLALSASLEAAGAGEAGRRFMVVAEGVRQLAEDSANAAYRVDAVVKGVQSEIQNLAERVKSGAQGVNTGYEVAARAGELLREIETLADQSARIAHTIAQATHSQVDDAVQVSQAAQSITGTATHTESETVRTLSSAQRLNELAQQLSAQLARFRLS